MNTIVCPSCGKPVEITQALVSQIQKDMEAKHQQDLLQVKELATKQVRIELEQKNIVELTDLKKQLQEKDTKVQEMRSFELKLREEKRLLEEREKDLTLEMNRRLDEERKKITDTVLKQALEEHRLRDLEKEKKITDMEKLIEELKRKAQQGSQQLQGEVQELDLEQSLQTTFLTDVVEPVEKGVRGADVRQIVKTPIGNVCGTILWESKRTKSWSQEWVGKLKEDSRAEKAHISILVSTILPEEIKHGFGLVDGVYVCHPPLALALAQILRSKLIDIAREKFINQNREGNAERLYEYVTSHEFRQQIEALVEVYRDMQQQISKERAAFEKIWKTREAQVNKMFTSTAGIVGSMRGRIGQSMPMVKGLELDELLEDEPLKLLQD